MSGATGQAEDRRGTGLELGLIVLIIASVLGAVTLVSAGDRSGVAGGVLLGVVALGLAGVLLGGRPFGPEVEGKLDLSSRIGLGLLGGLLGAAAAGGLGWFLDVVGLPGLLGVAAVGELAGAALPARLGAGAVWGMIFGVVLPAVPGPGVLARGVVFSLAPVLWTLLKVYPVDRDVGLFGVELGALAFVPLLLLGLAWGIVTALVLAWGERTELAPLDRPLGA